MKKRRFVALLVGLAFVLLFALSGCRSDEETPGANDDDLELSNSLDRDRDRDRPDGEDIGNDADNTQPAAPQHDLTMEELEEIMIVDDTMLERIRENSAVMLQLTPLAPGEELAVLHTNMGDITLRFFPEEAPLAVENFITHARDGYYDGVIFHRVMPNFMIQTGDPTGTGAGGESIWGHPFGLEYSFNLRHFRGGLAMAHAGGAMQSQFYIVQNPGLMPAFRMEFEFLKEMQDEIIGRFSDGRLVYWRDVHPLDGLEYFIENGGTPHLDWFWAETPPHTVFGHVVDGMDVVDAIAGVELVGGSRPVEDIIIERISFIRYSN